MTEMTNPQLGQTVLDPACGTGGFLACASKHMRKQGINPNDEQRLQEGIIGWEKKQLPYILCTTNMILHGLDVPNIQHLIAGSLAKPLNSYGKNDKVDIILTNPPFGGMEEDGIENNFPADVRTKETADLFLVLIMKLLKDGGKCAMVLPDGSLFGEGVKTRIKEKLLTECNLHTIIRLPKSVFAPYASINTNLLFFEKGSPTTATWFYRLDMPEGVKAFNKTNPMTIEHFAPVKEWWNNRQEIQQDGFDKAKQYTFTELKARNFNLDLCGYPTVEEEILEPKELISQYQTKRTELNANIDSILSDINKILGIA
jgi:type I restriction enzyme M protein